MSEPEKPTKLKTEGSARVLNEVMGRLESLEAGEMPVIERVGPDGSTLRVDHTGEMIRPDDTQLAAARDAAEAFAEEHSAGKVGSSVPPPTPKLKKPAPPPVAEEPVRTGFWARILSIFRRS